MSFKPIQFTYTPPLTVPSAPLAAATASRAAQNPLDREQVASGSKAASLLAKISSLKAASAYLQSAILALTANKGVVLNFAGNPELSDSLKRIYGSTTPPGAISIGMYSHLVSAEFGILRTDIALANSNSSLQASPYQRLDLQQATKTVEDALCEAGDFDSQLPLFLRELCGHDLMYDSLTDALKQYPILCGTSYAPPSKASGFSVTNYTNPGAGNDFDAFRGLGEAVGSAAAPQSSANATSFEQLQQSNALATMDCSDEFADSLDQRLDRQVSLYGQMYNTVVAATNVVGAINQDLSAVNEFVTTNALAAIDTIMCLMGAIKGIQAMVHKPDLKALKDTATLIMLPRLIAELGPFASMMDRMVQRVVSPVNSLLARGDALLAQVAGVERNLAYMIRKDGITGVIQNKIHGKPLPQMDNSAAEKKFEQIDAGMQKLYGYAGWANRMIEAKATEARLSLVQALDRSQQVSGDRLETLQSLKDIANLMTVFQSVVQQVQGGGSALRLSGTAGQVSSILTGSTNPLNGTATLLNQLPDQATTDPDVAAAVAKVPVPSDQVSKVLTTGGASLVNVVPFLRNDV
jgi:hypothetical protein